MKVTESACSASKIFILLWQLGLRLAVMLHWEDNRTQEKSERNSVLLVWEQERSGGGRRRGREVSEEGGHSKGRKGSCPMSVLLIAFPGTMWGGFIKGTVAA